MKKYAILHTNAGVFMGRNGDRALFSCAHEVEYPEAPLIESEELARNIVDSMSCDLVGIFFITEIECGPEDDFCDVLMLMQAGVRMKYLGEMMRGESHRVHHLKMIGTKFH